MTTSYSCHRNSRIEINLQYENLFWFFRYLNKTYRIDFASHIYPFPAISVDFPVKSEYFPAICFFFRKILKYYTYKSLIRFQHFALKSAGSRGVMWGLLITCKRQGPNDRTVYCVLIFGIYVNESSTWCHLQRVGRVSRLQAWNNKNKLHFSRVFPSILRKEFVCLNIHVCEFMCIYKETDKLMRMSVISQNMKAYKYENGVGVVNQHIWISETFRATENNFDILSLLPFLS